MEPWDAKLQEGDTRDLSPGRRNARPLEEAPAGRYRLGRKLGKGGMATVYEAHDSLLQCTVAVKLLAEHVAEDPKGLQRFLREAWAAAKVKHPNIVAIHDVAIHEGRHCIVMELMPGGSAQDRLAKGGLPWTSAVSMMAEVCRGLAAAHQAGLIHRDIKPGNILLTADGTAKLGDFGLVKVSALNSGFVTASGDVLGTPHFMSPEQCKGDVLDPRSDLYSIGATLYALLTGRPPFNGGTSMEVMFAHCSRPVPDPRDVQVDVPEAVVAVLKRAMEKKPSERQATAQALAAELDAALSDHKAGKASAPLAPEKGLALLSELAPAAARIKGSAAASATRPVQAMGRHWIHLRRAFLHAGQPTATGLVLPLEGPVQCVGFSPDGRWLAAGLREGSHHLALWDTATGEQRAGAAAAKACLTAPVQALAFSPDSQVLALGCRNGGGVRLWQLGSLEETQLAMDGAAPPVLALAFSANGAYLATGLGAVAKSQPGFLRLFDAAEEWRSAVLEPVKTPVRAVAFLPLGEVLVAAGKDGNVGLWLAGARRLLQTTPTTLNAIALAVSPDGRRLVMAGATADGSVLEWTDLFNEERTMLPPSSRGPYRCLAFAPDGKLLAVGRGADVTLWDAAAMKLKVALKGHEGEVTGVAFSHDGDTLASASVDKTVRLWDISRFGQTGVAKVPGM